VSCTTYDTKHRVVRLMVDSCGNSDAIYKVSSYSQLHKLTGTTIMLEDMPQNTEKGDHTYLGQHSKVAVGDNGKPASICCPNKYQRNQ